MVNVQTKVSWAWGYAVPTIAFGLALAIFLLGTRLYKFVPPGGSALTRIGQGMIMMQRCFESMLLCNAVLTPSELAWWC